MIPVRRGYLASLAGASSPWARVRDITHGLCMTAMSEFLFLHRQHLQNKDV